LSGLNVTLATFCAGSSFTLIFPSLFALPLIWRQASDRSLFIGLRPPGSSRKYSIHFPVRSLLLLAHFTSWLNSDRSMFLSYDPTRSIEATLYAGARLTRISTANSHQQSIYPQALLTSTSHDSSQRPRSLGLPHIRGFLSLSRADLIGSSLEEQTSLLPNCPAAGIS